MLRCDEFTSIQGDEVNSLVVLSLRKPLSSESLAIRGGGSGGHSDSALSTIKATY